MAYVDPQSIHNPSTGTAAPASWGDTVRDNQQWFANDHPRARVYNSSNISHTTSGSLIAVTFNSERYDVGGCHSTSSNTSRLTVPSGGDGLYLIGGHVRFALSATGHRAVLIRLNGSTYIGNGSLVTATSSLDNDVSAVTMYQLAAGDYVELVAFQSSGGALNMLAQTNYSPEFWFTWMANSA